MDKTRLNGKKAFITGADKGIGLATAKLMNKRGCEVIACTRQEKEIIKLEKLGFKVFFLDVTNIENEKHNLVKIIKYIDILVNNAGIGPCALLPKTNQDLWNQTLNTNLNPVYQLSQMALPFMRKKRWGRIINISSVLATLPQKGFSAYSASKSAIEGLTRTMALEYAAKGITINAVAPGFTDTAILRALGDVGHEMAKNIPVGFMAEPEDIAESICFLASDAARYITGEVLNISGGMKF